MSRGDNPLVRAVGRLPAKVHTKLLIAFVGTAVLLVVVGLLGLRVLGQSNDRVGASGHSRNEPRRTASSRATASHVRLLLAENVDPDFYKVNNPARPPTGSRTSDVAVDQAVADAARADRARDRSPTAWASCLRPRTRASFARSALKSSRLSTVIRQLDRARRAGRAACEKRTAPPTQAEQLASDLNQLADRARQRDDRARPTT